MEDILLSLFEKATGEELIEGVLLAGEGSSRRYWRLRGKETCLIGTVGTSREENHAFLAIQAQLEKAGLPVPHVVAVSKDEMSYLQDDLGDITLYDALKEARRDNRYGGEDIELLCSVMRLLPDLQFQGASGFDFSQCYPAPAFDSRLVHWDLNYFKYNFLKGLNIDFNENLLEDDFDEFATILLSEDSSTFMYRDFQSRNVMIKEGKPYFIDFQGGRRGPIYYDVASFVGQSRANYPADVVKKMVRAYMESLERYQKVDKELFMERLRYFILFRSLQTLGAYGFRGLFERKSRFIESLPQAMCQLDNLLDEKFPEMPYLCSLLKEIVKMPRFAQSEGGHGLTVDITSFSYKKGVPLDDSGNGGGFVFDCRAIENPGRYKQYMKMTGLDREVIKFLEDDGGVFRFVECASILVDKMVTKYMERGFTHISVCFGCTGGQHRSVYCTEHLAQHLAMKYHIQIHVNHRELRREYTIDQR